MKMGNLVRKEISAREVKLQTVNNMIQELRYHASLSAGSGYRANRLKDVSVLIE